MARPELLPTETIDAWLADQPHWQRQGDTLTREVILGNFEEAFAFMTKMAFVAEKMNHHPEWSNVYNRVDIVITTHDAGGLTQLDLDFAQAVNERL